MKQNKSLLFFGALIIAFILLYYFWGYQYFSLQLLQQKRLVLQAFVDKYYFFSLLLYMFLCMASIIFLIPVIAPIVIVGGFLFNVFWAAAVANVGITFGATIAFLFCKKGFADQIIKKYDDLFPFFKKQMQLYGPSFLLILNFMLIVPYALITVLAVFSNVSLFTYIWTTTLGFIPASLLYAYTGKKLATIKTVYDLFSFRISLMILLLIGVALLPVLIKKIKKVT